MVGWISYGASRDVDAAPNAAEIWAFYVAPGHWSSGVGRQLCLHSKTQLANAGYRLVSLWVLAENVRAIRFYQKAGFSLDVTGNKGFEIAGTPLQEVRYVAELSVPGTTGV